MRVMEGMFDGWIRMLMMIQLVLDLTMSS